MVIMYPSDVTMFEMFETTIDEIVIVIQLKKIASLLSERHWIMISYETNKQLLAYLKHDIVTNALITERSMQVLHTIGKEQ